jgi:hypothetical protein
LSLISPTGLIARLVRRRQKHRACLVEV